MGAILLFLIIGIVIFALANCGNLIKKEVMRNALESMCDKAPVDTNIYVAYEDFTCVVLKHINSEGKTYYSALNGPSFKTFDKLVDHVFNKYTEHKIKNK